MINTVSTSANGTNKYGELVIFSGPVCSECHQRVGIAADYTANPQNLIVCSHCQPDTVQRQSA